MLAPGRCGRVARDRIMALLAENKLAPDLDADLQHVIQALSDDDLATLARTDSAFLSGGFRASNTSGLRVRAFQMATGPHLISDSFRRMLARHSLNHSLIALLSTAALVDLRHDLAVLFGPSRVLLGALLDERQEVREIADRWLHQDKTPATSNPEQAASHLRERFARLTEAMGAVGANAPITRETWQDARQQLEQQLRDARAETRKLKGVEERLARARDQLAAQERELTQVRTRVSETETLLRQTTRERDATRTELDRELRHREERLLAAVEARLAEEAVGWLAGAHAVAVEATAQNSAPGQEDIVVRAEAALIRQASADRHSGNRVQLIARLGTLESRLAETRDALANALHPLPELAEIERLLAAETDRLTRLLRRDGERSSLEATLSARFATAEPNDLPALRSLSDRLVALGGISAEAGTRLIEALQRRQGLIHTTALPAAKGGETSDPTAIRLLKHALSGKSAAVLLIDGHNVLFGLQGRYMPPQGAAVPTAAARDRLVQDIVRLTGDRPTCRAWIVFDGPSRSESTAASNVRVTYSGGEGEHRADTALLDNVRFFKGTSGIPVILVSNDMSLCTETRRLGASTLSAADLAAFL